MCQTGKKENFYHNHIHKFFYTRPVGKFKPEAIQGTVRPPGEPDADKESHPPDAIRTAQSKIRQDLFSVAANARVSFTQIVGDSMHSLMKTVVHEARAHPSISPDDLIPHSSAVTFSRQLNDGADGMYNADLEKRASYKGSLLMDSGTIAGHSYLVVLLDHPQLHLEPLLLSFQDSGKRTPDYVRVVSNLLSELWINHGIEIVSVTTDGEPAQVAAIKNLGSSIYAVLLGPDVPVCLFHSPCLAHKVQCAFRAARRSGYLFDALTRFDDFTRLLRKKEAYAIIGAYC
jgi:hypothetical protein